MATNVDSIRFTSSFNWTISDEDTFGDLTTTGTSSPSSTDAAFTHGTGANQVDLVHLYQGTLAASASLTLDLSGSMTDAMGNAFVLAKLKGLYVRQVASSGNTSTGIVVAATVANGAVQWNVPVTRGGVFSVFSPTADALATVTAGTADQFVITNSDATNSAEFFLAILGTSV